MTPQLRIQRFREEEVANVVTHGAGFVLAIIGTWWMLQSTWPYATAWHVVSVIAFGGSLMAVFLSSSLYHGAVDVARKAWLNKFDHVAIHLLIAGTYTPFALLHLRDGAGMHLFLFVWALAVFGIYMKVWHTERYGRWSLLVYLVMGYSCVPFMPTLFEALPPEAMKLLITGGVAYTLGVGFYLWDKQPFAHTVWHLFVLAGAVLHYIAVLWYVLPVGSAVV